MSETSQTSSENEKCNQQPPRAPRKKQVHNAVERRRKDKINGWITKIAQLLPSKDPHKQSKISTLEQTVDYIRFLTSEREKLLSDNRSEAQAEEVNQLKKQVKRAQEQANLYETLLLQANINLNTLPKKSFKYTNKFERANGVLTVKNTAENKIEKACTDSPPTVSSTTKAKQNIAKKPLAPKSSYKNRNSVPIKISSSSNAVPEALPLTTTSTTSTMVAASLPSSIVSAVTTNANSEVNGGDVTTVLSHFPLMSTGNQLVNKNLSTIIIPTAGGILQHFPEKSTNTISILCPSTLPFVVPQQVFNVARNLPSTFICSGPVGDSSDKPLLSNTLLTINSGSVVPMSSSLTGTTQILLPSQVLSGGDLHQNAISSLVHPVPSDLTSMPKVTASLSVEKCALPAKCSDSTSKNGVVENIQLSAEAVYKEITSKPSQIPSSVSTDGTQTINTVSIVKPKSQPSIRNICCVVPKSLPSLQVLSANKIIALANQTQKKYSPVPLSPKPTIPVSFVNTPTTVEKNDTLFKDNDKNSLSTENNSSPNDTLQHTLSSDSVTKKSQDMAVKSSFSLTVLMGDAIFDSTHNREVVSPTNSPTKPVQQLSKLTSRTNTQSDNSFSAIKPQQIPDVVRGPPSTSSAEISSKVPNENVFHKNASPKVHSEGHDTDGSQSLCIKTVSSSPENVITPQAAIISAQSGLVNDSSKKTLFPSNNANDTKCLSEQKHSTEYLTPTMFGDTFSETSLPANAFSSLFNSSQIGNSIFSSPVTEAVSSSVSTAQSTQSAANSMNKHLVSENLSNIPKTSSSMINSMHFLNTDNPPPYRSAIPSSVNTTLSIHPPSNNTYKHLISETSVPKISSLIVNNVQNSLTGGNLPIYRSTLPCSVNTTLSTNSAANKHLIFETNVPIMSSSIVNSVPNSVEADHMPGYRSTIPSSVNTTLSNHSTLIGTNRHLISDPSVSKMSSSIVNSVPNSQAGDHMPGYKSTIPSSVNTTLSKNSTLIDANRQLISETSVSKMSSSMVNNVQNTLAGDHMPVYRSALISSVNTTLSTHSAFNGVDKHLIYEASVPKMSSSIVNSVQNSTTGDYMPVYRSAIPNKVNATLSTHSALNGNKHLISDASIPKMTGSMVNNVQNSLSIDHSIAYRPADPNAHFISKNISQDVDKSNKLLPIPENMKHISKRKKISPKANKTPPNNAHTCPSSEMSNGFELEKSSENSFGKGDESAFLRQEANHFLFTSDILARATESIFGTDVLETTQLSKRSMLYYPDDGINSSLSTEKQTEEDNKMQSMEQQRILTTENSKKVAVELSSRDSADQVGLKDNTKSCKSKKSKGSILSELEPPAKKMRESDPCDKESQESSYLSIDAISNETDKRQSSEASVAHITEADIAHFGNQIHIPENSCKTPVDAIFSLTPMLGEILKDGIEGRTFDMFPGDKNFLPEDYLNLPRLPFPVASEALQVTFAHNVSLCSTQSDVSKMTETITSTDGHNKGEKKKSDVSNISSIISSHSISMSSEPSLNINPKLTNAVSNPFDNLPSDVLTSAGNNLGVSQVDSHFLHRDNFPAVSHSVSFYPNLPNSANLQAFAPNSSSSAMHQLSNFHSSSSSNVPSLSFPIQSTSSGSNSVYNTSQSSLPFSHSLCSLLKDSSNVLESRTSVPSQNTSSSQSKYSALSLISDPTSYTEPSQSEYMPICTVSDSQYTPANNCNRNQRSTLSYSAESLIQTTGVSSDKNKNKNIIARYPQRVLEKKSSERNSMNNMHTINESNIFLPVSSCDINLQNAPLVPLPPVTSFHNFPTYSICETVPSTSIVSRTHDIPLTLSNENFLNHMNLTGESPILPNVSSSIPKPSSNLNLPFENHGPLYNNCNFLPHVKPTFENPRSEPCFPPTSLTSSYSQSTQKTNCCHFPHRLPTNPDINQDINLSIAHPPFHSEKGNFPNNRPSLQPSFTQNNSNFVGNIFYNTANGNDSISKPSRLSQEPFVPEGPPVLFPNRKMTPNRSKSKKVKNVNEPNPSLHPQSIASFTTQLESPCNKNNISNGYYKNNATMLPPPSQLPCSQHKLTDNGPVINPPFNPVLHQQGDTFFNLNFQPSNFPMPRPPTQPLSCSCLTSPIISHTFSSTNHPVPNFNLSNILPDMGNQVPLPPMKLNPSSSQCQPIVSHTPSLYPPHPPIVRGPLTPQHFSGESHQNPTFTPTQNPPFRNVIHSLNFPRSDR